MSSFVLAIETFLLWRLTGGKVHATGATNASRTLPRLGGAVRMEPNITLLPSVLPQRFHAS